MKEAVLREVLIHQARDHDPGCSDVKRPSGSTPLIVSLSQIAARIETFMIAVLPQIEHPHRSANGETAAVQSQLELACFIGGTLLVGFELDLYCSESTGAPDAAVHFVVP